MKKRIRNYGLHNRFGEHITVGNHCICEVQRKDGEYVFEAIYVGQTLEWVPIVRSLTDDKLHYLPGRRISFEVRNWSS